MTPDVRHESIIHEAKNIERDSIFCNQDFITVFSGLVSLKDFSTLGL